jgi:DNA-directed RNA polymerase subunit RPC12/RpoP
MRDEIGGDRPEEQNSLEGLRAAQERDDRGRDRQKGSGARGAAAARADAPATGVLTVVCVTCGREYHFDEGTPPEGFTCEKCGNEVFRSFFSPDLRDEAAQDFIDSTARDLDPDQPSTDTMPGDVLDLNRT